MAAEKEVLVDKEENGSKGRYGGVVSGAKKTIAKKESFMMEKGGVIEWIK